MPHIEDKTHFRGRSKSGHADSETGGHAHSEMTGHLPEMGGHDGLKYAGYVAVDLRTCQLTVTLVDEKHGLALSEKFPMRSCREKHVNSPDYFSSNYDADLKQKIAA